MLYLAAITVFAFIQLGNAPHTRRTFEFFTIYETGSVIEDRMFSRAGSAEAEMRAYLEELILGPGSYELVPLIPRGTSLRSFLYRNGTVYADFSRDAAFSVEGGRPLFDGFLAINQSIRRNFRRVSDVRLFIEGNEVFFREFEEFFGAN